MRRFHVEPVTVPVDPGMPPGRDWVLPDEEHAMPDPHLRAADSDRAEAARPVPADAGPDRSLRAAWGSWASTALIVSSIWAVTSIVAQEFLYFWPFRVIVPWGGMLLIGTLGAQGRRTERRLSS